MRYLVIDIRDIRDNYNYPQVFDTLKEVETYLCNEAEEYDDDYLFDNFVNGLTIYEIENIVPHKLERGAAKVMLGVTTEIPAPLPGESVTDYAARITRG